ncbi:hypothetical protein ACLB1S_22155 [Escherichia coli]
MLLVPGVTFWTVCRILACILNCPAVSAFAGTIQMRILLRWLRPVLYPPVSAVLPVLPVLVALALVPVMVPAPANLQARPVPAHLL